MPKEVLACNNGRFSKNVIGTTSNDNLKDFAEIIASFVRAM
jgi:hypothetical protein